MTLAQLQRDMSSTEFELWMAFRLVQAEECPNCGVEARDLMRYQTLKAHCPVCKHDYTRLTTVDKLSKELKGR